MFNTIWTYLVDYNPMNNAINGEIMKKPPIRGFVTTIACWLNATRYEWHILRNKYFLKNVYLYQA